MSDETEAHFKERIADAVARRADAVRAEAEITNEIAALLVDARKANVPMRLLAEWVQVLNPKTGEMRSISRQAVDNMVSGYTGRPRAPRKKPARQAKPSRIVAGAFE